MISSSVQNVTNDILNSPETKNNVSKDIIDNVKTRNSIMGSISLTVSKIEQYKGIEDRSEIEMPYFDLSVSFKNYEDFVECFIRNKDNKVVLERSSYQFKYSDVYDENMFVNLFLHTIKSISFYDLF